MASAPSKRSSLWRNRPGASGLATAMADAATATTTDNHPTPALEIIGKVLPCLPANHLEVAFGEGAHPPGRDPGNERTFLLDRSGHHRPQAHDAPRWDHRARREAHFRSYVRERPDVNRQRGLPVVRPERRVPPTDHGTLAYLNAIGEVEPMLSRDHAPLAQDEHRLRRADDGGLRDGVDPVQPKQVAVSAEDEEGSSAEQVAEAHPNVVTDVEILDSCEKVEMPDAHSIPQGATVDVEHGQPDANAAADPEAKNVSVTQHFEAVRQEGHQEVKEPPEPAPKSRGL